METGRREFLRNSAALAIVLGGVGGSGSALASTPSFSGIIYTKENPGKWAKKVTGHAPVIKRQGNNVTIRTKHSMSEAHFIVRHTLVLADGTVSGAKTFSPSDEEPVSVLKLPDNYSGKYYVTSFCNKHDLWLAEGE